MLSLLGEPHSQVSTVDVVGKDDPVPGPLLAGSGRENPSHDE
jgi:hypothetical protein